MSSFHSYVTKAIRGVNTLIFPMFFRYKREEVKIQAWVNHEKRKAEMEMKKMEVSFLPLFPSVSLVHCS